MVTRCIQDGNRICLQLEHDQYKQQPEVSMVGEQFLCFGQDRPISDIFLMPARLAVVGRPRFSEVLLDPLHSKVMEPLRKRVFPPIWSYRVRHVPDWLEIGLVRCMARKKPKNNAGEEGIILMPPPAPGSVDGVDGGDSLLAAYIYTHINLHMIYIYIYV